jgi:hypothetical protein
MGEQNRQGPLTQEIHIPKLGLLNLALDCGNSSGNGSLAKAGRGGILPFFSSQ